MEADKTSPMTEPHTTTTDGRIEAIGLDTPESSGPYGHDKPCEEVLVIDNNEQPVFVPVTAVRSATYDYYGNLPEVVTFDVVHADSEGVSAVSELDDGAVIEIYEAKETWEMTRIDDPTEADAPVVWTRSE